MTFMPLNAMRHHLPDFIHKFIDATDTQRRFLHCLRWLPRLRVYGAGDLIDVVAQAGHVRFQLVDLRWYGWGYGLEQHALPRILADGKPCRCRVRTDRCQLAVGYADIELVRSVLLAVGGESPSLYSVAVRSLLSV